MTERRSAQLILAGLVLLLLLLSYTTWKLIVVGSQIEILATLSLEDVMQSVTENVTRPNGAVVVVVTEREPGESVESWGERHQEAVEYWENN